MLFSFQVSIHDLKGDYPNIQTKEQQTVLLIIYLTTHFLVFITPYFGLPTSHSLVSRVNIEAPRIKKVERQKTHTTQHDQVCKPPFPFHILCIPIPAQPVVN